MSKYVNQFEVIKNYISKNYISNQDFTMISKEELIIDVRFNTSAKLKIINEVLELYIKKNILEDRNNYIYIK